MRVGERKDRTGERGLANPSVELLAGGFLPGLVQVPQAVLLEEAQVGGEACPRPLCRAVKSACSYRAAASMLSPGARKRYVGFLVVAAQLECPGVVRRTTASVPAMRAAMLPWMRVPNENSCVAMKENHGHGSTKNRILARVQSG